MKYLLTIATFLLFTTCAKDTTLQKDLIGKWKAVDWVIEGQSAPDKAKRVGFSFDANNLYSATYGNQKETGIYNVNGNSLYTTATNKIEKMVGISFSNDTLIMDMNRIGTKEALVLVKEK